jgi:hypothetical protein
MRKAGAGERALSGSEGSERFALRGAFSSCRADRFFVAADAFNLILHMILFNCFFVLGLVTEGKEAVLPMQSKDDGFWCEGTVCRMARSRSLWALRQCSVA